MTRYSVFCALLIIGSMQADAADNSHASMDPRCEAIGNMARLAFEYEQKIGVKATNAERMQDGKDFLNSESDSLQEMSAANRKAVMISTLYAFANAKTADQAFQFGVDQCIAVPVHDVSDNATNDSKRQTDLLSIFGIKLGQPTTQFPACVASGPQSTTCFAKKGSYVFEPDYNVIEFPNSIFIATSAIRLFIYKDNVIDGVAFDTGGISLQGNVENELSKKYGQPTSRHVDTMENSLGASFDVIHESWDLPGVHVIFDGAEDDDITKGYVRVMDDYGEAALKKSLDELNQQLQGPKP